MQNIDGVDWLVVGWLSEMQAVMTSSVAASALPPRSPGADDCKWL